MPTSALLERVEQHINRLDRALKDSEDLLKIVKSGDREERIQQLQERLAAGAPDQTGEADVVFAPPARPYCRS